MLVGSFLAVCFYGFIFSLINLFIYGNVDYIGTAALSFFVALVLQCIAYFVFDLVEEADFGGGGTYYGWSTKQKLFLFGAVIAFFAGVTFILI